MLQLDSNSLDGDFVRYMHVVVTLLRVCERHFGKKFKLLRCGVYSSECEWCVFDCFKVVQLNNCN